MTLATALRSRWLAGSLPALLLTANAAGQAPEIFHFTFDAGDASNTAVPGVGDGVPGPDVAFGPGGICPSNGDPAASSTLTGMGASISTGWQVDLGASDWTIGMHIDLTVGSNGFQYYFGSSSASSFRCFSRGAAGADGIMLRSPAGTGGDVIIAGGASSVVPTHVCWVYDSSVPEITGYLDGVPNNVVQQPAALNFIGTAPDFLVMRWEPNSSSSLMAGNIMDDFRFYRRAITQSEIDDWVMNCAAAGGCIGTNFECPATVPNSSLNSATICASGSTVAANNNVTLTTTGLPVLPNSFGYFLNSMAQNPAGFMPPGSQGNLCVGPGGVGRYNGNVFNSAGTGEGSLVLDLANTPTPAGSTSIQAGETWYFTTWFRDSNPTPTSNFSDGVCITFN